MQIAIGIGGLCLSALMFFVGQKNGAKMDGQKQGELFNELKHIKEDLAELKKDFKTMNIETLRADIVGLKERVERQNKSLGRCHKRLDDHLSSEHLIKVEPYEED